jgi:hypothetical protein
VVVTVASDTLRIDTWQMGDDVVAKAPYVVDSVTIRR